MSILIGRSCSQGYRDGRCDATWLDGSFSVIPVTEVRFDAQPDFIIPKLLILQSSTFYIIRTAGGLDGQKRARGDEAIRVGLTTG